MITRLYEHLNEKQLQEVEDPLKDKKHLLLPHFHRDTASMKMKDTELNRIIEEKEMFRNKVEVLTKHNDDIKKEKASLSIHQ